MHHLNNRRLPDIHPVQSAFPSSDLQSMYHSMIPYLYQNYFSSFHSHTCRFLPEYLIWYVSHNHTHRYPYLYQIQPPLSASYHHLSWFSSCKVQHTDLLYPVRSPLLHQWQSSEYRNHLLRSVYHSSQEYHIYPEDFRCLRCFHFQILHFRLHHNPHLSFRIRLLLC